MTVNGYESLKDKVFTKPCSSGDKPYGFSEAYLTLFLINFLDCNCFTMLYFYCTAW